MHRLQHCVHATFQRASNLPAKPRYRQDPGMPLALLTFSSIYLHRITRIYCKMTIYNVDECFGLMWCVVCAWNGHNCHYPLRSMRSIRIRPTASNQNILKRHIWIFTMYSGDFVEMRCQTDEKCSGRLGI